MITKDRLKEGQRVRIVHNPITRKYGVRVSGPFASPGDDVAWPGEIGTVVRMPYTASNGEQMAAWFIEFERARRFTLGIDGDNYFGAQYAVFYTDREADYFRRAK